MKQNDSKHFARVLKALMTARGLTLQAMAEQVGVDRNTIGAYRSGRLFPRMDKFERIRSALGCTRADLLGEE